MAGPPDHKGRSTPLVLATLQSEFSSVRARLATMFGRQIVARLDIELRPATIIPELIERTPLYRAVHPAYECLKNLYMSVKSEVDELEDDIFDTSPITDSPANPFDASVALSTVIDAKKPRRFPSDTKVVLQRYLDGGLTKPQFGQLQEIAQKTGLSTQQIRSWFTHKRTKAHTMTMPNQVPPSGRQVPQQHVTQSASGGSTARTEAHSPSAPRSNRRDFLDAYFRYRKFSEGKPRLDIDGAERDAAVWYTTFHGISLEQLRQANDHWYPLEQESTSHAPQQPPMQLHTPSPSSPSPSPEAPVVSPHVKPDPYEAEDREMGEDVDEELVQDARFQSFLDPMMLDQEYHLLPSASIQELFSNLHSDSIASFIHAL